MTKGPPALLPLLAIVVFRLVERGKTVGDGARAPTARRALVTPASLLAFLVVAGTWFVVVIALRPSLLGYFLRYEVVDRVFTPVHERNPEWYGAFKVYLPTLLVGSLPWLLPVLGGLRRVPRLFTGRFWRRVRRDEPERLFLLLWLLLPLTVFCLARSRLPLYVLPLFAPISLLVGRQLASSFELTRARKTWLAAWIVGLLALKATAAYLPGRPEDSRRMARAIEAQVTAPYSEVAFFDRSPRYGLSLYLDVEIEELTLTRMTDHPDRTRGSTASRTSWPKASSRCSSPTSTRPGPSPCAPARPASGRSSRAGSRTRCSSRSSRGPRAPPRHPDRGPGRRASGQTPPAAAPPARSRGAFPRRPNCKDPGSPACGRWSHRLIPKCEGSCTSSKETQHVVSNRNVHGRVDGRVSAHALFGQLRRADGTA